MFIMLIMLSDLDNVYRSGGLGALHVLKGRLWTPYLTKPT